MDKLEKENNRSFVLITGASSGIGRELADVFASKGYGLVLASRNIERLDLLAEELRNIYASNVHTLAVDLSVVGSAERLLYEIADRGIQIEILVNNAGTGCCGMFHEMQMQSITNMMRLNMESLTYLARQVAMEMAKRGSGRILNVASTGAYQPGPYIAVYYASKAYVLSLSHAMAEELKDKGVVVSALCPGATRTGFAKAAGKADISTAMDPAVVAKAAYKGLMKGKRVIIPGSGNKIAVFFTKLMPGRINAAIVKKIQKKMIDRL